MILPDSFLDQYPRCFPVRSAHGSQTRHPPCGAGCGPGWWPILRELFARLENLNLPDGFSIEQVKEKFGGLRVSTSCFDVCDEESSRCFGAVNAAIREAESKSWGTCEACGQPGQRRRGGWIKTLCDECHAAREASR